MAGDARLLVVDFAKAQGIENLEPEEDGGYKITIGAAQLYFYAIDHGTLLVAAPLGELPTAPSTGLIIHLLELNMFHSPIAPFQVGLDAAGGLTLWGRIPAEGLTTEVFAGVMDQLSSRVEEIQDRVRR